MEEYKTKFNQNFTSGSHLNSEDYQGLAVVRDNGIVEFDHEPKIGTVYYKNAQEVTDYPDFSLNNFVNEAILISAEKIN